MSEGPGRRGGNPYVVKVDLRKTLFILPNLFTLSSVFCGFYALLLCMVDPTDEEVAQAARITVPQVAEVRAAARAVTSLDRPVSDASGTTFQELLAGEEEDVEQEVTINLAQEAGGPLIVAGSLYLVGHVRARLLGESPWPDDPRPRA